MTVSAAPAEAILEEARGGRRRRRLRGTSDARAYGLGAITAVYLLWALVPVAITVLFSFNEGRSRSTWQGFSLRWVRKQLIDGSTKTFIEDPVEVESYSKGEFCWGGAAGHAARFARGCPAVRPGFRF